MGLLVFHIRSWPSASSQLLSVGRSPHDSSVAGVLRVIRQACGGVNKGVKSD
jgi:hypothetical protein